MKGLRTPEGLGWLLSILAVGLLAALVLPMLFSGQAPGIIGFAYFLAVALMFTYILLIVIPRFPTDWPTPFRLRNGTDRKLKKFKVARKCANQQDTPLIDEDFSPVTTEHPFGCIPSGRGRLIMVEGDGCDVTHMEVSVTFEDDAGNVTVYSSGMVAVAQGEETVADCVTEIYFQDGGCWADVCCTGMQPPCATIELKEQP